MLAEQLKKSILQAAIQGKLTDQRKEDGNAQDLYNQIQEEKQKLIKEKKIKKAKPLPKIEEDEIPFEIPENWMWVRLGDILYVLSGRDLTKAEQLSKQTNTSIPYITGASNFDKGNLIITAWTDVPVTIAKKGDILLTVKGTIGKTAVLPIDKAHIARQIMALRKFNDKNNLETGYLLAYLSYHIQSLKAKAKSMIPGIDRPTVLSSIIPLPPLAEQKRIVETIQKYLAEIEQLEKDEEALAELQKAFPGKMKASILQQAIQGKLTDQRKEDGTAQDLYNQIQEEKQRLIKEKKIKKEKPLPEITADEIPFEIPENWMWVRWGTLSISIKYGYNTSAQKDGKIKMVRISDIQNNQVNWDSVPFCNIPKEEINQYLLRKNDILFARTGGTVGKSYLVSEVPENVVYAGYLIRTRYSEKLSPQYLKYFMESDLYWSQLKKGTTTTAQPNCNAKTLGKMVLPLPPLAEQKRIVEKLNKLLPLCEA